MVAVVLKYVNKLIRKEKNAAFLKIVLKLKY